MAEDHSMRVLTIAAQYALSDRIYGGELGCPLSLALLAKVTVQYSITIDQRMSVVAAKLKCQH